MPDTGLFITPPDTDSLPRFTLPSLAKGDIVNIRLDFPDLIASANPKTFEMRLLYSSGSDIYNQPLPMGTTLTIDQSTKSYQTFWTVPAAGTYTLQIISEDPAASEALHWYYLTVWKAKDGTPVLRATSLWAAPWVSPTSTSTAWNQATTSSSSSPSKVPPPPTPSPKYTRIWQQDSMESVSGTIPQVLRGVPTTTLTPTAAQIPRPSRISEESSSPARDRLPISPAR